MIYKLENFTIGITVRKSPLMGLQKWLKKKGLMLVVLVLSVISVLFFIHYYLNGLGLAYNDARSHLDIGRRVVDGLKPGLAQVGSVWLPLPHILMILTVWNNFFWHSGLSGAIQSMVSYVAAGALIFLFLEKLKVGLLGRLFGVFVFALNVNVLYLQSTAMTELFLLATMLAGVYYLMLWHQDNRLSNLIKSSFWIMTSTLIRYDGWFLFFFSTILIVFNVLRRKGYKQAEGTAILFATLGGIGIFLWFLWNALIFKDPLYFVFGPFSAKVQQQQIYEAGELLTKGNILFSIKVYLYAVFYNSYMWVAIIALIGAIKLWMDKNINKEVRIATISLIAPLIFNVLTLYLGHSVLFVKGLFPDSWFNVRYGLMLMPSVAIFSGYLLDKLKDFRWLIIGSFLFTSLFAFANADTVTLDDALIGASGKNVTEVSSWLSENVSGEKGFVLISVASHDAIVFSSGLDMKRFIHEGTGKYWEMAIENPDKWAKWIVVRTNDMSDMTFREIKDSPGFARFELIEGYPFADIYQLKRQYWKDVVTDPILAKTKMSWIQNN